MTHTSLPAKSCASRVAEFDDASSDKIQLRREYPTLGGDAGGDDDTN